MRIMKNRKFGLRLIGRTLACLCGLGFGGGFACAAPLVALSAGMFAAPFAGTADTAAPGLRLQKLSSNALLERTAEAAYAGQTAAGMRSDGHLGTQAGGSVLLPFFDDFSYEGPYPDPDLWQDKSAFVNNAYAFYPPTYGVATFDAIDEKGALYRHGGLGVSFSADTLTSRPIRLDSVFDPVPRALTTGDSIILSFYYQPGGGWGSLWDSTNRGQSPNASDRLLLEFYSEELSMWVRMWGSDGMSLSEFCPLLDSAGRHEVQDMDFFRYVEVPITTPGFNKRDFRFRFRAYSSVDRDLRTGGGQWHIDYVYLHYGRTPGRTRQTDMAFVEAAPTVTADYMRVPWRHFNASDLRKTFGFKMTHLGEEVARAGYRYVLRDVDGAVLYTYPGDSMAQAVIYPFVQRGYTTEPDLSPAAFGYDFADWTAGDATAPRVCRLEHIVQYRGDLEDADTAYTADFCPRNDTMAFTQVFGDEFAYDDGTAEAGLGPTYAGGALAVGFSLRQPDTLTALRLFFNRSYNDANSAAFSICVWRAELGDRGEGYVPGVLLYESDWLYPVFEEGLNRFYTYNLGEGGMVLPQGRFFVGIRQSGGTFLNLGFDQNNDARAHTHYYYLDAETHAWRWRPIMYHGALMLRPAFGMAARRPVANEGGVRRGAPSSAQPLRVYPNPLRGEVLHIVLPEGWSAVDTYLQLSTIDGRLCRRERFRAECPADGLEPGVYVLRLVGADGRSAYAKIVIP